MHTKQFDYRSGLDLPELADKIVTFFAETEDPEPEISVLLPNDRDTKLFIEKKSTKEAILEVLENCLGQAVDEKPLPVEPADEEGDEKPETEPGVAPPAESTDATESGAESKAAETTEVVEEADEKTEEE